MSFLVTVWYMLTHMLIAAVLMVGCFLVVEYLRFLSPKNVVLRENSSRFPMPFVSSDGKVLSTLTQCRNGKTCSINGFRQIYTNAQDIADIVNAGRKNLFAAAGEYGCVEFRVERVFVESEVKKAFEVLEQQFDATMKEKDAEIDKWRTECAAKIHEQFVCVTSAKSFALSISQKEDELSRANKKISTLQADNDVLTTRIASCAKNDACSKE